MIGESWAQVGSSIAGLMFAVATLQQFFPHQLRITVEQFVLATLQQFSFIQKCCDKLAAIVSPYVQITFPEYSGYYRYNEAYPVIETYLGTKFTNKASQLQGSLAKKSKSLLFRTNDSKISDDFNGIKLWWTSSSSGKVPDETRSFQLTFHRRYLDVITGPYLNAVLEEGKGIDARNKQRKLHTNNLSEQWHGHKRNMWSAITFENPVTFQTLAMDPKKKEEIINDLLTFSKGKEYYSKVGKAWKRGYLLHGPPGTGKSSMIAAMANLLNYDVYDIELTAIKNNTELRKLLIETSYKSIIVIEDIDCSVDLTGRRKDENNKKEDSHPHSQVAQNQGKEKESIDGRKSNKVTLSGLLNFIDGIWSACGQERIIVFTTNHVDKLDPALIRRGRMDMHIELSYCSFEAFKILAKNYLDLDSHHSFEKVRSMLKEINMTPADVAECLMPKSGRGRKDADTCLDSLIHVLEDAKEKAKIKDEKEGKPKAEGVKATKRKKFRCFIKKKYGF